jgi:hypothetical protein
MAIKKEVIELSINEINETIRGLYNKCKYNEKFKKTNTYKKLKTILTNSSPIKRLYPLEIILGYSLYLTNSYNNRKDIEFIKQSDLFLNNYVYDERENIAALFENMMVQKYGQDWNKKIKFEYKE